MIPRVLFAAALVALVTVLSACAHQSDGPDLAVDRVILYQSGVAYVERSGTVTEDTLTLRLRPDQINDVLSSLVVVDLDHGTPATVSLPARAAEGDGLALPEVGDAQGMLAFLQSLRGADVRIRHKEQRTRGRILGVEASPPRISLLVDGSRARFIALSDIEEVELENDAVAMRIRQSLDESMSADDWQSVELTLRFPPGERSRELLVAWVVEMPLWKPAYRVLIDGDEFHLQGWAVVDNLSGEDWNDVELSLASGTPLSFRFDLHSPIRIQRPDMSGYGVPQAVDLRPPAPMRATPSPSPVEAEPDRPASARGRAAQQAAPSGGMNLDFADVAEAEEADDDRAPRRTGGGGLGLASTSRGMGAGAEVRELDSLYRFDIPERVTLPDRSSTLVTLVNARVGGEDKLVFQPGSGASRDHPYRSLLLQNTTDGPVQRSPVAIYKDGAFVGEGITPAIAPGERAVLPYAIESRVHVNRRQSNRSGQVQLIRIVDGRLQVQREDFQIWRFEITSSLDEDQTLHVQVPRHQNFELQVGDDLEVRREDAFYLVPIEVAANGDTTQEIAQVRMVPQHLEVFHAQAKPLLVAALERGDLRPDVAEKLRDVTESLDELAAIERKLAEDRELRRDVQSRTNELRQNIQALGDSDRNQALRDQLLERLEEQDELQATLAARIVENSENRSALRIEIQEKMREITLERRAD